MNFLGARNDRIVFEATHVLAMMTLPPHAHRHATDPSPYMETNASRNSLMRRRLLTVAKGQGAANSSMDLVDYLRSNATNKECSFQFYGEENSSHEPNAQVVTIRIPPFQACEDDERTDLLAAPAACAAANTCEVLIQQYHVPVKYHFSLFTKIRECYAARSKRSKEAIVVERMYALVALFYAFGESWDVTNYIEQSPELTRGIVELIRVEIYDTIPVQVRVGALQVLTALVHDRIGRGGGIGVLGRQSNVLSILGVTKGTPHGVFPSLVRFCMAELGNVSLAVIGKGGGSPTERRPDADSSATTLAPEPDNDMDMSLAVAFVQATADLLSAEEADIVSMTAFRDIDASSQDAKLYWAEAVLSLLTAVVAIQSGAAVLTENGVIPALLHVITTPAVSSYHLTLITQCVQALETTVNNHASAAALYRDLNGVGIIIDRLMVECSSISTASSPGVLTPSLSETNVVFLVALLIALSTSFHSQGVMTAGATSRVIREGSVLSKVLTKILGHIDTFGPVLFSQAAVVVSDVINNDPSSVNHVHSSGIADVLLKTLTRWDVSELYPSNMILPPCSQLAIAIPSVLNALSLTTSHAEKVAKYDPLLYLLDMFASPQYTEDETINCFQGDVPSIVGTGIFELVRHVPSFQNAAILACVKALKKITRFGEEILEKHSSTSENGIILRMAIHLSDLLEPVLSKSEHAAFFADHSGVQLLLKLYHLILPTGASFISNNLGDGRSHDNNSSPSHHAAAQSITLALHSFASQQPTSMLTAIIQEVTMQLDSLKSARTAIGLSWSFSESEEGAEGILCPLPELSVPFGEKSTIEIVEGTSRNDKIEAVGVYLRVLATIEWQCALLIWTIQVVQSHLQCRRWFTEFSSKPTQQILSRLFSVDRSCQYERAKLASLHQVPSDVKTGKDETSVSSQSRASEKRIATSVWKVGSLLLLRFTIVMRNLLSAYGKAFLSAPLRRGDENGALLAPHARALAKTVANILNGHLRYVLSENRANEIDEFTRQYYLTFLLETFVCCVIGNKKNHANTLVLVELMKPTALPPPIVKTEQTLHQDESMGQEISTTVQVSSNDQSIPDTQISSILTIIGEFFTICLRADKNDEGFVVPSKMDLSSFRVAARALRKLSDLSNISKSPLTSALIVNEESSLPSIELEGRFDPRKLTVQLHCMCTQTLLAIWNHQNFVNLPIEGYISEMLPVAVTLLKNRLDQDDANVESASTRGIESEFEFGRRQGFGFGRETTDGSDIDSLSLRSALFGGSSSRLSGRANPRDFAVDPRIVESLTAMGFTSSRVEHAIRRIQVNDVELAMEWILSHPEEDENEEEEMGDDADVSLEVPMEDAAADSDAKTQEKLLFELYGKLRDTYEQVCFSILQSQSSYFVPISANEEPKSASGELYRGQHFVMTVAEYLCFLCRQSDSERRLVISRLTCAILEWFETDVDRNHRFMAMLAMLSHVLALVLRLDVGSRAVLQEESPHCVQKLLDFVSNISRDSQLRIVVAPVLLAVGALVGDKTAADTVKPDQVVDAADSVKHRELEFQERLMNICMLLLKHIAAPITGGVRNQLNSNIAHAIWQLLARLTLNYELASSFFNRGGIDDILTISDENIFPGYCELTCTLLLQVMESPEVLQQMMEENILQAMSKLSTRYGSPSQMRFTPRALLMEVAPIAARNEELFLKALQNTISMKKSDSGRVYVVPKKSRPEGSSSVQTTSDPTELSHQLSDEAKDKKSTNHHKVPKGHKHQAQMIIHKIIDKIQSLWEIEKTSSKNDESNSQEGSASEDTQPVVCVGMYLRFLVHLVTFFPVCATVLAKAKYNASNGVARDTFIRTVLMEFLPSKDLCQFAALRKSLREGGLYGSNAGLAEGGAEIFASEAVKFVDKRTRERVQNAHRLLVGIGSHSGEGSKCIIMELVRLLQEWPSGAVEQHISLDSDITISDELALSKLHAWSGLIMSILWPKGSSKGFAWDKVVLGGGLKGKHSFVTLLAEALRKIDLAHPLAHATCSMLLRPLATLTRSFVTHRVRRLLKKRHSSSSENEAIPLTSHSPDVTPSTMLDHSSSNDQVSLHPVETSSIITNRPEGTADLVPSVSNVGDDIGDITMQSPQSLEDDHEMLDGDGGERSDDDDASERSSVSVRSTDDGDDDEEDEDEDDGEDDEDEDEEEDDEDDEDDDDDEDEDDEDERMNLRILRRRDGSSANRRVSGNRLWGSLDAELSILDALDEVDEEEFSYPNLLDDEASFADEQRRRIRRAARANGTLAGSSEDNNSSRPSSTWNDERIVRSVMGASNLSSSGIDTQTDVIPFVSDDGDNESEEQSGESLPDTTRFPLGQRDSAAGTAMLLQFIEDLPGVEDEFLFDSLDSRGARGHRSRSDHRHNRGAASGLDMSASSITHPLLRSDNTAHAADNEGDQMPDRLGLPRHSSLLRELQELTEHVQNQMPFSFGGSRARLGLGGIAREPLHRGGGGRARPPSRSNRLSAVSNLLSEFSLDIPASSQMRLHDSRIDSQFRHYGLGASQVFGGHRASRGDTGDGNSISVWGPPGASREVNIRSMVSRLEQRIGEVCTEVTNDDQTSPSAPRNNENLNEDELTTEDQEHDAHSTTEAESMVMDELSGPIDSTATEDTNTVHNILDASRHDSATPADDQIESSEVASDTASVLALASTFGESSLQSPGDTDNDHNTLDAVAPTPAQGFDTEVHETDNASTDQDVSNTAPPPAPVNASSGSMLNFTLDLSSFQAPSSSAGSVSDLGSTAPDRSINSLESHEETKSETEVEGSRSLNEATITEATSGFVCPEGIDPEVFDSLPPDMQAEIIAQSAPANAPSSAGGSVAATVGSESFSQMDLDMANSSFDRETLEALPADIRAEVLANERREREAVAAAAAEPAADISRAQEMDNASFVASLAPELREEILVTCDDAFLQTLPSLVRAEAMVLRERVAFRSTYREPDHDRSRARGAEGENGDLFRRPTLRRMLTSQGDDGLGGSGRRSGRRSFYSDGTIRRSSRRDTGHGNDRAYTGKLRVDRDEEEDEHDRIFDDRCVKSLLRLLFMAQSVIHNRVFQRLLANICLYPLTRQSIRTNILRIISLPLDRPLMSTAPEDKDDSFPPLALYGCSGSENRVFSDKEKLTIPGDVVNRTLHVLVSLAKYNPRFTVELLQAHGMRRTESVDVGGVSKTPLQDESGVAVLIELLAHPVIYRNGSNLDTLLELIELVLAPLQRFSTRKEGEETKEEEDNVDPSVAARERGEWVTVPPLELDASRMNELVRILGLDICTPQMQERTIAILRLLNRVAGASNRQLVMDALVRQASALANTCRYEPTDSNTHYESSAVLRSAQDELQLLRLLHTLSDVCGATGSFTECCRTIGLDPLWDALSASLEDARSNGGLEDLEATATSASGIAVPPPATVADDDSADGMVIEGKSAGASCAMAALLARFLPMVEAFFVVNARDAASMSLKMPDSLEREEAVVAALRLGGLDSAQPAASSEAAGEADGSKPPSSEGGSLVLPLHRTLSRTLSEPSETMRLANFVAANRVLLNTLVREKPSLLETSLAALIKMPRCRAYLDFDNKRTYFQSAMKRLRQTALRSHGGGSSSVRIPVRRDHIFEDSYYALRMRSGAELRRKLHISFTGEEGIDAGGVTREWYMMLAREMFNPNYVLFTSAADSPTFQPNPLSYVNKDHLSYFEFVGKVLGKAVADGQLLDAHFTRSFYKHILQIPISYHDMEAIDPEYYRNLHAILDHPIADLGLDLTFSAENLNFGKVEIVDLIPNGRHIAVTDSNKLEYVQLVTHHRMATGIRQQIDAFLHGFHQLVPPEMIAIFNENELELLISGMPEIDIDDLKANTEYANFKPTDSVIRWFWNVLYTFTHEERALFLQFVTGTSKVPLEGFKALEGMRGTQKFNIHKAFGNPNALPSAHTWYVKLPYGVAAC